MQINTKYDIGTHIWIVAINLKGGELYVFDTYIVAISIDKDGIIYLADSENFFEVKEEDIILYDDKDKLYEVIKTKMIEANKIIESN